MVSHQACILRFRYVVGLILHSCPYFVLVNSEGFGETVLGQAGLSPHCLH